MDMTILEPIKRMNKEIVQAGGTLSDDEARFLVDAYYQMQDNRICTDGQIRAIIKQGDEAPHSVLTYFSEQYTTLENQVKRALERYAASKPVGQWMLSQHGIGSVITAGIIAHIDITKCPTSGHIESYAGLTPETKWIGTAEVNSYFSGLKKDKGKYKFNEDVMMEACRHFGKKYINIKAMADKFADGGNVTETVFKRALTVRPWNATLKSLLAFKAGECFVKTSNSEKSFYGALYKHKKLEYAQKNLEGGFSDRAKSIIEEKNFGSETVALKMYKEGRLPDAHIHSMARRYAVKIFISHLHEIWHFVEFGRLPPLPYALSQLGHAHLIGVPNGELIEGYMEAASKQGVIRGGKYAPN